MTAQADNKFEQVVHKIAPGSKLLRAWALKGGVSAQVTALEIEHPDGHTQKLIIRQHGAIDLQHNPQIAADEFKLLHLLHAGGLAAPMPLHLDQSCEIFPTPYVVLEYIEGQPEFAPANLSDFLLQFATYLSRIHQAKLDVSFLPQHAAKCTEKLRVRPAQMDDSLDEGHIRDILEAAWPFPQKNPSVLLHGDFWPGNLLWKDGRLVAVIDWEDTAIGDPLADVANSRLEVLWAFGIDAMNRFTQQYQALAPFDFTNLPYWDLCAALRPAGKLGEWAADASTEQTMRARHRRFITQAFEKLSIQG